MDHAGAPITLRVDDMSGEPAQALGARQPRIVRRALRVGLWAALLIAFGLGAIHALTPGHGKTIVGAYLWELWEGGSAAALPQPTARAP